MTQPVLHSPAFCGSTVWTQHVDWPAQTAKDGRKNVRFFFFFFFQGANPQGIPIILNYEHARWRISDQIWNESDATEPC